MVDPRNYDDLLINKIQPQLVDNVVLPKMERLLSLFTQNNTVETGELITDREALTETANGGAMTRGDAFPQSMESTWAHATWRKVYYQEASGCRAETIDQCNGNLETIGNVLNDMATKATRQLMNTHVYGGILTQIAADVDSNNTYGSVSALTRGTELQGYEENTSTAWTLALHRAMSKAIGLKQETDWSEYISIFNPTVWYTAWPLIDALVTKTQMSPSPSDKLTAGYMPPNSLDGIPVTDIFGVTAGCNFLLNRTDVQIQIHKPLELILQGPKELGAYEYKITAITGQNGWVRHPARNGKLTAKT